MFWVMHGYVRQPCVPGLVGYHAPDFSASGPPEGSWNKRHTQLQRVNDELTLVTVAKGASTQVSYRMVAMVWS